MAPFDPKVCAAHLQSEGFAVLPGVFPPDEVASARQRVLNARLRLKNTRPNPEAGHLAGFHRYPELESLHSWITGHPFILSTMRQALQGMTVRSIGLSDITVNRSQAWHVDLLRGRYQHHLNSDMCWGPNGGGVFKALVYLQSGASLKVIPGAHRIPRSLASDHASEPADGANVHAVHVNAGDVVLLDVRMPHCGSTDEELAHATYAKHPKILVSTVLGGVTKPLTRAMEKGNLERLLDWEATHA